MSTNLYEALTASYWKDPVREMFLQRLEETKSKKHSKFRQKSKTFLYAKDQITLDPPTRKSVQQNNSQTTDSDDYSFIFPSRTQSETSKTEKVYKFPKFSLINEVDFSSSTISQENEPRHFFQQKNQNSRQFNQQQQQQGVNSQQQQQQNHNQQQQQQNSYQKQPQPTVNQQQQQNSYQTQQQQTVNQTQQQITDSLNSPHQKKLLQSTTTNSMSPSNTPKKYTIPISSSNPNLTNTNQQYQQKTQNIHPTPNINGIQQQIQNQIYNQSYQMYQRKSEITDHISKTQSFFFDKKMNQNCQKNNIIPQQSVKFPYLNKEVNKQSYGIITNQKIPLILDRSDKFIQFTDVKKENEENDGVPQTKLQWNTLSFVNTNYYEMIEKTSGRTNLDLQHSETATNLYLIEPHPKNVETQHHPNLDVQPILGKPLTVTFLYDPNSYINDSDNQISSFHLRNIEDLSGKKGTLILLEQTSEYPPFILNVGMASKLVKYWHQTNNEDNPPKMNRLYHIIKPNQESPFIAQIPKSRPVYSIACHLFDVPLAKHKVAKTDFLLVRSIAEPTKFYLRHINKSYCAGLLEAKRKVLRPNKKTNQTFISNFLKAILINLFRGTEQFPKGTKRIKVATILKEYFPDQTELKLRDVLKSFAENYRQNGNGFWEPKKNVDLTTLFVQIPITPEEVCSYQSMQAGFKRLRRSGVNILIRSKKVYQNIKNLKGELTKKIASKIEIELMKTPWARTENFTKAFEGQLMEFQRADNGEQYYRSKGRRSKNDGKDKQEQPKKQRHNTDSDLRVLTIPQLIDKLKSYHVPLETINKLSRWGKVKMLKKLASDQAEAGIQNADVEKYARGPRSEFQAKIEEYKKQYQQSFENNLNFISSTTADDTNDFKDESLLDDISLEMSHTNFSDDDSDEDEKDELDMHEFDEKEQEKTKIVVDTTSTGDPPELKPYGIATHHFDVDWSELHYSGYKMRTAAKLIHVSYEKGRPPIVSITWRRAPHQILELQKLENFVNSEQTSKGVRASDDLELKILLKRKRDLQDKLRRTKGSKNKKATTLVQDYISSQHQIFLVTDSTENKTLSFHITPDFYTKITTASQKFEEFLLTSKPSKKKKSSSGGGNNANNQNDSDDNDSDDNEGQEKPHGLSARERRNLKNPLGLMNDIMKSIIQQLIENDEYVIFTYPPHNKYAPPFQKNADKKAIDLQKIRDKANEQGYTTIERFFEDVRQLKDICMNDQMTDDYTKSLCEQMYNTFNALFKEKQEELEKAEKDIDVNLKANPVPLF